jgi:hypothetical protein
VLTQRMAQRNLWRLPEQTPPTPDPEEPRASSAASPWGRGEMPAAAHAGEDMALAKWLVSRQSDPGSWPVTYWEQSCKSPGGSCCRERTMWVNTEQQEGN